MLIKREHLEQIYLDSRADLDTAALDFNDVFQKYNIRTLEQRAHFIAQIGHESNLLNAKTENLNYSEQGLRNIFGHRYFSDAEFVEYARKPEKIANRVYGNRMGNHGEASGDGWRFRGRGYIQLTGRNNYEAYAKYLDKSLDDTIIFLESTLGSMDVAGWYWTENGLNELALQGSRNVRYITKRINGGYNGIEHRKELFDKAIGVLRELEEEEDEIIEHEIEEEIVKLELHDTTGLSNDYVEEIEDEPVDSTDLDEDYIS